MKEEGTCGLDKGRNAPETSTHSQEMVSKALDSREEDCTQRNGHLGSLLKYISFSLQDQGRNFEK
jgi:hypothetical protein